MFAFPRPGRKPVLRTAIAAFALLGLAACQAVPVPGLGGAAGPQIDASKPVPVALLVPKGATGGGGVVGRSLENAALLALSEMPGRPVDLRIYDTAGDPGVAASAATTAVREGAQILIGPLYTQSTSAATGVIAGRDINMLSFSNNTAVAGGNVFILGQTFRDTANRMTAYARNQGIGSVAIVHAQDVAGEAGRAAIAEAASANGLTVSTVGSYPLSQQGISEAAPRIAEQIRQSGAQSVFLTANVDSDLPLIASALIDAGISKDSVRFLGLTRWNSVATAESLPALQGGWFTLPDQAMQSGFETRYRAAYGEMPHPLAGLAYDGVKAVGTLIASGRRDALSAGALTGAQGFSGATGAFRLLPDGTNQRGLAIAQVQNNRVLVIDPAPKRFGRAGF